ncbi:MAG: tRNA pseudouridine(55) synthase TruB [Pseudomonadota bacterium]
MNDGILLVDKAGEMTSHDVVGRCRRLFGRKDIGHAGTLDPMATGLLVILVGKATKLSDFLLNNEKAYEAVVELGRVTDTDDVTGETLKTIDQIPTSQDTIQKQVMSLSGALELPVPIYSAIKVKGKKLYEKARKGEDFKPPMRTMEFRDIHWRGVEGPFVSVSFTCSKGSYVRAWAKELGEKLECGATLAKLRRIHSSPYHVEQALSLQDLEIMNASEIEMSPAFTPLNRSLAHWPSVRVDGNDEKLIRNGQIPRKLERYLELEFGKVENLQGVKVLSRRTQDLVALLNFTPPLSFKIRRVFPNQ